MRWPFRRDGPPQAACYQCGICGWGGQITFDGRPPNVTACPLCGRPTAMKTCN